MTLQIPGYDNYDGLSSSLNTQLLEKIISTHHHQLSRFIPQLLLRSRTIQLPIEIFDTIIGFVIQNADLKALRLVNKAFSVMGAVRLFHSVQLGTLMREPHGAEWLLARIGHCIRVIEVIPKATLRLDSIEYARVLARGNIPYLFTDKTLQDRHMDHIELVYQMLLLDRYQPLSNKKFKALLGTTLQHASKVETFFFTDRPTERTLELPEDCEDDECQDLQRDCHKYSENGNYDWEVAKDWREKIGITLAIITTTGTGVQNVTFRYRAPLLGMNCGTLQVFNDFAHVDCLTQSLTSIRWKHLTPTELLEFDLSSLLSRAINIQRIYIDAPHGYRYHANPLTMSAIFGYCQLPKLMIIGLTWVHSTQPYLYNFLGRHPTLEQIHLDSCSLKEGTWEQTIARLHDRLGMGVLRTDDMARWKCNSSLGSNAFIDLDCSFETSPVKSYSDHELPDGQQETGSQADVWLWKKKERPTYRALDPVLLECWLEVLKEG